MPPKATRISKEEGATKKRGTKKDPNAPKKALSAFMIFSQENRQRIKDEHPEATFGEIGKHLGSSWRDLSEKEKQIYNEKAEDDKARYERDMAAYKKGK